MAVCVFIINAAKSINILRYFVCDLFYYRWIYQQELFKYRWSDCLYDRVDIPVLLLSKNGIIIWLQKSENSLEKAGLSQSSVLSCLSLFQDSDWSLYR